MKKILKATVVQGMFANENAVTLKTANGADVSLFVDADMVWALGGIRVELIDTRGDRCLVRLPAESFEAGWWVTVMADQLLDDSQPAYWNPYK
jgi:hypothetical protein